MNNIEYLLRQKQKANQVLRAIYNQMPHFSHVLEHPETGYDVWLHDLILEALTFKPDEQTKKQKR